MISLKRYLDQDTDSCARVLLEAYRAAIVCIAENGRRTCPVFGQTFQEQLGAAEAALRQKPSSRAIKATHDKVLSIIRRWGDSAEDYFKQKASEVKELLMEMASTAEHLGKRNERYACKFAKLNTNLLAIAELEDLSNIRRSLLVSAAEMRSCIDQMHREDRESMDRLKASLSSYQVRLEQAEQLASRDALTGLFNRRAVEARIQRRIAMQSQFCVVILDLNEFKQVNDRHGHIAGDELLRRIAVELKAASRADDIIGRWGGDEFVLVLDCPLLSAKMQLQRLRPWVFGDYDIELGAERVHISVTAAIGMAEWMHGESMLQVLGRADTAMYRDKTSDSPGMSAVAATVT